MARLARTVQRVANAAGFEIVRYLPRNFGRLRRRELLRSGAIDVLVDVGAADGTWAAQARTQGFRGRIVSLEPRPTAFAVLHERALRDGAWECHEVAVAATAGRGELSLAGTSSSLRPVTELHRRNFDAATSGTILVPLQTLDDVVVLAEVARTYLKIDVEGHELDVLRGGEQTVERCAAVEVEVGFAPLYEGQPAAHEVMEWLAARDFRVVAIDTRGSDPQTGDVLDANIFFERRPAKVSG